LDLVSESSPLGLKSRFPWRFGKISDKVFDKVFDENDGKRGSIPAPAAQSLLKALLMKGIHSAIYRFHPLAKKMPKGILATSAWLQTCPGSAT
jgi:hypothetical protein